MYVNTVCYCRKEERGRTGQWKWINTRWACGLSGNVRQSLLVEVACLCCKVHIVPWFRWQIDSITHWQSRLSDPLRISRATIRSIRPCFVESVQVGAWSLSSEELGTIKGDWQFVKKYIRILRLCESVPILN